MKKFTFHNTRKGQTKVLVCTNFILGETMYVQLGNKMEKVKLIKTSPKGYNLLIIDRNECLFPLAKTPCKYGSVQISGTIPILHSQKILFLNK